MGIDVRYPPHSKDDDLFLSLIKGTKKDAKLVEKWNKKQQDGK